MTWIICLIDLFTYRFRDDAKLYHMGTCSDDSLLSYFLSSSVSLLYFIKVDFFFLLGYILYGWDSFIPACNKCVVSRALYSIYVRNALLLCFYFDMTPAYGSSVYMPHGIGADHA